MVYGDVSGLDQEDALAFKRAGTYHLFAVSGQNVGIMLGFWILLLQYTGTNRWKYSLGFIPVLFVFSMVSGNSASVLRAFSAAVYCTIGWFLKRKVSGLNCWAFTLLLFLLIDPLSIMDASLELSYSVVLALLLLSKPLFELFYSFFKLDPYLPSELAPIGKQFINRIGKSFCLLLSTSLSAWLGAWPWEFCIFHSICWLGIFYNIIAVPIAEMIVLLGSLAAVSGFVSGLLASILNKITHLFLLLLLAIVHSSTKIPGAIISVPDMKILSHPFDSWLYVAQAQSGYFLAIKNKKNYFIVNSLQPWEEERLMPILQKALFFPYNSPSLTFRNGEWFYKEKSIGNQWCNGLGDSEGLRLLFRGRSRGEIQCLIGIKNKNIFFRSLSTHNFSSINDLQIDLLIEQSLGSHQNHQLPFSSFIRTTYGRRQLSAPLVPFSVDSSKTYYGEGIWVFVGKEKLQIIAEK
ncbi:hypothetical protein A7Q09_03975 [Methylacidiphilum sp. Yel]|jgi:competence protein ComEC|uniref:ComEC/Rec2 family competence protein n=1 Tax=Methylacidiphilum sp. Yel TaxID=1847730 RepID=UPI00106A94EC|nr:ComEC/Rec2 family competence protein [Methylacidiphilum sp. Yel]TFE70223.1 hypothetical protein A7Q09_03975 [Methylacidiphilum sp. Yel]